ncbi:MAG: permease, partial [Planctomycetes bacterium]|nr:permease [Planctomycetota bacterium]
MSSPPPAAAPLATRLAGGGTPLANRMLFLGLILTTLALFPPLAAHRPWHDSFTTYFIAIVLESVPYILIGSLVGGLIEVFLPATVLPRLVARLGILGIPVTALAAPAFPACECGVLAVARGLMRKGLPLPHTITYLLAGPILNPTVLFTTWLAFRDHGALYPVLRACGALVVAVAFGFALRRVDPRRILLPHILAGLPGATSTQDATLDLGGALRAGGRCGVRSAECGVPVVQAALATSARVPFSA